MRNDVPHLLVYISGHGFGHAAQVAPVLNHLSRLLPDLRLTICSKVPIQQLQSRIRGEFTHIDDAADFGMVMESALDVLPEPSLAKYREFHHDWSVRVNQEAGRILQLAPDAVVSNVAYLPLAAARQAGINSIAMSSLNWADIFAAYCGGMPGTERILEQIRQAYNDADRFLRIQPGMPMQDLANVRSIGPIASVGNNRRAEIGARYGISAKQKLVLVSMGGITMRLPMNDWPHIPDVRWIVQADWEVSRADVITLESLQMEFLDVLASCDILLCKPGYGSFAEAACNGIPVLYVAREDWPEEPYLITWLEAHGACRGISRAQSTSGEFAEQLLQLFKQPKQDLVQPSGIVQAAEHLVQLLR
jgi:hypothetical protein